jgi:hypothetical protein
MHRKNGQAMTQVTEKRPDSLLSPLFFMEHPYNRGDIQNGLVFL